ncbi:class I SAM-dependent methyltransferase [Candidatus Parcubacteria bacterium]|nr:class I SAM-dependent methyltransferase [Candidatus Parcubacteria bacterium]
MRTFGLDKKAVLDIGSSYGEHLAHFGPRSVGITIVPEEAEYGKRKRLDVRHGNIEDDSFAIPEKFDAIFCNNLLEHLYSPHAFLAKLSGYLKPGGLLILGVPCVPKIASLLHLKKFRGSLAEAHINFFTKETLTKTAERAGYKIKSVRGFHFKNPLLDHLLDPIYPHFYAAAVPIPDFKYTEKRMKELKGYGSLR